MSTVALCVCTRCMLLGAPELLESLHQLETLRRQLDRPPLSLSTTCQHPEGAFAGPAVRIGQAPWADLPVCAVLEQLSQEELLPE